MFLNCGAGEDSWESLGQQGDQPVHPKGNQSWIFIGRADAEAETPILWPPDAKSWLIWKDPDAGKDWRQEEKGATEDEMAGWHHRLDACDFKWTPGIGDGQGGLVHGVAKSWTWLSDWTELSNFRFDPFQFLFAWGDNKGLLNNPVLELKICKVLSVMLEKSKYSENSSFYLLFIKLLHVY